MTVMPAKTQQEATDKLQAYESIAAMNRAFALILEQLRELQELGILRRDLCRALQVAAEETRAWANFEITEILHDREQSEWGRFGRLRRQWEQKYEDPNDLLLKAASQKNQRLQRPGRRRSGGV